MSRLDAVTIKGFKSIQDLSRFKLGALNVLVGANGAGKSNLVDFFRLLRAMSDGGLQSFVTNNGGADTFLFGGPKETKQIAAELEFGSNRYRFVLAPSVAGELVIQEEAVLYTGGNYKSDWRIMTRSAKESGLQSWKGRKSSWKEKLRSTEAHVSEAVSSWMVYHFHDTSSTAPVRRDQPLNDFRELRPDAGNIASFLLKMRGTNAARYDRIRDTIQSIAPFFDDFLLEPKTKGDNELVRLEWRQKGSSFPFQPWQFSDGTIRFICVATALLQPSPPSTIIIDEPELGLHPYALEVLAQLIKETSGLTQLVISTQSAPLLNQFEPEHVVVVERSEGASLFRRLEAEPLQEWLKDYALGELLQKNIIEAGPAHA